MVTQSEVLAIIQARGGSKGLPNKNLRIVDGHPLIAYSIESARASTRVTRAILSTDSKEIADAAHAYGAEIPFLRPGELAADDTPDLPLFAHALDWLWRREGYRPDIVVQLRPTTPLRPRGMIDRAVALLQSDPQADCVRAVTTPKQTPYKMWRPGPDGVMTPLLESDLPEPYNMPRQKLPAVLWQTGHVDVIRTRTILEQGSLTGRRVLPIMVEPAYCIDIDGWDDLEAVGRAIAGGALDVDVPSPDTSPGRGSQVRSDWLPVPVDLVVFDFDGVFTDNRVLVSSEGTEFVTCDRGDGHGIALLRQLGIPLVVLSTETNPVVSARCRKLSLHCIQGVEDKLTALHALTRERGAALTNTVYVGNDVNDLACLQAVGCAVVPSDAHPLVRPYAQITLTHAGGGGAVRELCDLIINRLKTANCTARQRTRLIGE